MAIEDIYLEVMYADRSRVLGKVSDWAAFPLTGVLFMSLTAPIASTHPRSFRRSDGATVASVGEAWDGDFYTVLIRGSKVALVTWPAKLVGWKNVGDPHAASALSDLLPFQPVGMKYFVGANVSNAVWEAAKVVFNAEMR